MEDAPYPSPRPSSTLVQGNRPGKYQPAARKHLGVTSTSPPCWAGQSEQGRPPRRLQRHDLSRPGSKAPPIVKELLNHFQRDSKAGSRAAGLPGQKHIAAPTCALIRSRPGGWLHFHEYTAAEARNVLTGGSVPNSFSNPNSYLG